jgi:hypothetical protein
VTGLYRVYVFDPTALVLLFAAHQPVFEVYRTASRVAFPAAAIGEANIQHCMCGAERLRGIVVTGRAVNVYDRLKLPVLKL